MLLNAIICDTYHFLHALINQYISIWSLWYRIAFFSPVGSFFQPPKILNLNMDLVTLQLSFTSTSYFFRNQELGIGISTLYWAIFSESNSQKSWQLSIETLLRQNSLKISCKNVYSRVFALIHFFSFAVPLKLLSFNPFSALQYLLNFYFT